MQANQLKQRIDQIEECADDAKQAVSSGSATPELRQCVNDMHQQARQLQQACANAGQQQQMGQNSALRQQVAQLEQTADRAMQACRQAGSQVDQQTQQAVQRAHQEISSVKQQMQ